MKSEMKNDFIYFFLTINAWSHVWQTLKTFYSLEQCILEWLLHRLLQEKYINSTLQIPYSATTDLWTSPLLPSHHIKPTALQLLKRLEWQQWHNIAFSSVHHQESSCLFIRLARIYYYWGGICAVIWNALHCLSPSCVCCGATWPLLTSILLQTEICWITETRRPWSLPSCFKHKGSSLWEWCHFVDQVAHYAITQTTRNGL